MVSLKYDGFLFADIAEFTTLSCASVKKFSPFARWLRTLAWGTEAYSVSSHPLLLTLIPSPFCL